MCYLFVVANGCISPIHCPPPLQFAVGVYDQLMDTGRQLGVRNAGMYALNSLRMEKGYRHWGHELDTETTPLEARLTFAVDMKKVCHIIDRDLMVRYLHLIAKGKYAWVVVEQHCAVNLTCLVRHCTVKNQSLL